MKKKEFIARWVEAVREGRRKNFPGEITPAEEAVAVWSDQKIATGVWRKYALHQATREQLERILEPDRLRESEAGVLVINGPRKGKTAC
jgi:hypothetical protein